MRVGFFGDSFVTFGNTGRYKAWPLLLTEKLEKNCSASYLGISGSSHWIGYQKFIKEYKNFDVILFSHTSCYRWPCMPAGQESSAWNIGQRQDPDRDYLNKIRNDIFSSDLLQFIGYNIYNDINRICQQNNIYLINIVPFEDQYEIQSYGFPIVRNLQQVSLKEEVRVLENVQFKVLRHGLFKRFNNISIANAVKNKLNYFPTKIVNDFIEKELREAHLNSHNSATLANILLELVEKRVYNITVDLLEYEWEIYDHLIDKIYEENFNNR